MVECSLSRQRRPPCKTNKEMTDEAADAAAHTYLLTYSFCRTHSLPLLVIQIFHYPSRHPLMILLYLVGAIMFFPNPKYISLHRNLFMILKRYPEPHG